MSHGVVPDRVAEGARAGIGPVARALAGIGISANAVTIAGGVLSVVGAGLIAANMPLPALAVLLIGTLADTLDGQIAKAAGGGTRLGAFLDSTVDRVADGALFVGAAASGAYLGQQVLLWASLVALVASFLVPYVRAKAESLGVGASVGPAPREARIVIFLIGLARGRSSIFSRCSWRRSSCSPSSPRSPSYCGWSTWAANSPSKKGRYRKPWRLRRRERRPQRRAAARRTSGFASRSSGSATARARSCRACTTTATPNPAI